MLRRPLVWLLVLLVALGLGWAAYERHVGVDRAGQPEPPQPDEVATGPAVAPAPEAAAPAGPSEAAVEQPPLEERTAAAEVAADVDAEVEPTEPAPEAAEATGAADRAIASRAREARTDEPGERPASQADAGERPDETVPEAPIGEPPGDTATLSPPPEREEVAARAEPVEPVPAEPVQPAPVAAPIEPVPAEPVEPVPAEPGAPAPVAAPIEAPIERAAGSPDEDAETTVGDEESPGAAPARDPDPAPWRPFSLESLHGVLSNLLGRDDEKAGDPAGSMTEQAGPPGDEPVAAAGVEPAGPSPQRIPAPASDAEPGAPAGQAGGVVPEVAARDPDAPGAPEASDTGTEIAAGGTDRASEAPPEWAPWSSRSVDSIRRALSAMLGGAADEPEPGMPEPAAGPPEPTAEPVEEPVDVARAEPEEPQGPVAPQFDIVRVGPDGRAVIAGRAEPGTEIEVKAGEQVIDRVAAGRRGHWVATPLEPLKPGDHELTLVAWRAGEPLLESEEVVVVVVPEPPPPQPAPVASGEPPPPQPAPVAEAGPGDTLAVAMPRTGAGQGRILQAPGRISGDGQLALMVVDYDEHGMTRLTGEAPPGSAVRIYVDNQPAGEVIARAGGEWATVLDARLQPGTYTLRLDQLDGQGRPVARLETPFTRVSQPPIEGDVQVDYVVVQPGNSLWRISRRLFGQGMTYVHIYEANQAQIRDPDLIYPGQVFEIPKSLSAAG